MNFGDPLPIPYAETIGGPLIYGGSIGINRILEYFARRLVVNNDHPNWTTYLFNIDTIFRNIRSKKAPVDKGGAFPSVKEEELTLKEIIDDMVTDISLFATYIDHYNRSNGDNYLILYYSEYDDLNKYGIPRTSPHDLRNAGLIKRALPEVIKRIPESFKSVRIFFSRSRHVPSKDLVNDIRTDLRFIDRNAMTLMISHHPHDLHLVDTFRNLFLIESYTGTVKGKREFNSKLSVHEDTIPFNEVTHRAFGDKTDLKPSFSPKDRKKLIEMSQQKRWQIRTIREIEVDIEFAISAYGLKRLTE